MATPVSQDLTLYYNGTQITGTSGNVTRALKRLPSFAPFTWRPDGVYAGMFDVWAEQGDPAADPMAVTLSLTHKIAGVASALAAERECMDEMRSIQELINPFDGAVSMRFDRSTAAAAAVSTELLYVRPVSVPRYSIETFPNDGLVEVARAFMETEWEFWAPIPYFVNRTASTQDIASGASQTLANPGVKPCGVRFAIKAASVAGSPTQITITNTTNGYVTVWTKATAFAAGEYIDWCSEDPRQEQLTAGTALGGAGGADYCELSCGNNSVSVAVDTGSLTLTASWKPHYLSL